MSTYEFEHYNSHRNVPASLIGVNLLSHAFIKKCKTHVSFWSRKQKKTIQYYLLVTNERFTFTKSKFNNNKANSTTWITWYDLMIACTAKWSLITLVSIAPCDKAWLGARLEGALATIDGAADGDT